MPNKYKRKTNRGMVPKEIYELAAEGVMLRSKSLRGAAQSYDLNHTSLYRCIKKKEAFESNETTKPPSVGHHHPRVFAKDEEKSLCEYLLMCSDANFGLSTKEARRLAYKLAVAYNRKCPSSWVQSEMAGEVWLRLYMKRHGILSLRMPQATSIARATSFNKTNVELFFNNYSSLLERYHLEPKDIWNVDESGITSVQKPDRVIARRGQKQFKNHVRPSKENMVLLLLDNYALHTEVKNINFCKENGIILLTFPPHCTHKLQPMDRAIFGPFKKAVNTTCDNWMRSHPGKVMTIYDIPAITVKNVTAGFQATGIWPLNTKIFGDEEFLPSQVTNRSLPPSDAPDCSIVQADESQLQSARENNRTPSPSVINTSYAFNITSPTTIVFPSTSNTTSVHPERDGVFSPEAVRPLPKAGPRKATQNRRKVKSAILTDTPVKNEIEKENRSAKTLGKAKNKKSKSKKEDSSSDDEDDADCYCAVCIEPFSQSRPKESWVQCVE
nr:unnamed protein product [Callosobruchus analis]